jgi:hypothetical protein
MTSHDELLSTTAPFSPAPTQSSEPALPAHKTPQKTNKHPAGSQPSARTPARRHHVIQHKGSDDGDDDGDGDVPRDLRPVPAERDLYSVNAFCARHSISRDKLYELWRERLGPETVRIGSRQLITREAAARWRKALERAERERKRMED